MNILIVRSWIVLLTPIPCLPWSSQTSTLVSGFFVVKFVPLLITWKCVPLVDLLIPLLWAGRNGLPPTPDTLNLGCSYPLHSSHRFLSTWSVVMQKLLQEIWLREITNGHCLTYHLYCCSLPPSCRRWRFPSTKTGSDLCPGGYYRQHPKCFNWYHWWFFSGGDRELCYFW